MFSFFLNSHSKSIQFVISSVILKVFINSIEILVALHMIWSSAEEITLFIKKYYFKFDDDLYSCRRYDKAGYSGRITKKLN
jgi:hypothetical protein